MLLNKNCPDHGFQIIQMRVRGRRPTLSCLLFSILIISALIDIVIRGDRSDLVAARLREILL